MQFCSRSRKHQIPKYPVPYCTCFVICHPMFGTQRSEKFWLLIWLRGSWVWHSDKPAIHGHAPPEPLSRSWQGLTWPHEYQGFYLATPCDTWMSKLRARPQTEPSCKGLAVTLLSRKLWQGSFWDKQPGIQEIGSCSTSTIAGRDKTLAGHRKF